MIAVMKKGFVFSSSVGACGDFLGCGHEQQSEKPFETAVFIFLIRRKTYLRILHIYFLKGLATL